MTSPEGGARDVFAWISEIDAASLVMVAEGGLADPDDASAAARAILAVRADAGTLGAPRPADYLDIQRLLRAQAGAAADVIHIGRSRQDILATVHRLLLRDRIGTLAGALLRLRVTLLATAASHVDTLVPAYTNGVQAQPTTFGHVLLGYEEAFARSA
jgi:argininosuccinate lyase